jgi:predicted outer membrane repeat protein
MSLTLTNTIYGLLSANTGLTAIVGQNIFPLIAPQNSVSPMVILRRSFSENYSKDGGGFFASTIDIRIYATSYNDSIKIAQIIDGILNFYASSSNNIKTCRIIDCNEDWNENDFIQNITYELKNL